MQMKNQPPGKFDELKKRFKKLGFWKRLILILTTNTIIILIVTNVLMIILLNQMSNQIIDLSNIQKQTLINKSNSQVALSAGNRFMKGVQVFAGFGVGVAKAFQYFYKNKEIYASKQSGVHPYNPPLTSQMRTIDWTKTAIYFFNQNSTFQDNPYLDDIMATTFTKKQYNQIKRMSVIYQSTTDPSDIFARTVPASPDFNIPSVQDVNARFEGLAQNYTKISGLYNDTMNVNKAYTMELFAMRTLFEMDNGFRALIQVEVYKLTISYFIKQLYYMPSSLLIGFKILSHSPPSYQIMNRDSLQIDLTKCFETGTYKLEYYNGTKADVHCVAMNESFRFDTTLRPSYINTQAFRLALIVNQEEVSNPHTFISTFLQGQSFSISLLIGIWSAVILFCTISLSIVAGNYIFHNLKTLAEKLHEYTKNPKMMHKIIFALKELETNGIIKKLIDNTITILEKIEERKKSKNNVIKPIQFPLNLSQFNFLRKNGIKDQEKLENIKKIILKQMKEKGQNVSS